MPASSLRTRALLLSLLLLATTAHAADAPPVVLLWPGGAPGSEGKTASILKYRLAREEGSTYQVETHALADTQRAIRLVRHEAKEWGVDPATPLTAKAPAPTSRPCCTRRSGLMQELKVS